METETIKAIILADYKTLLALRYDSPLVIYDKLKLIGERIQRLADVSGDNKESVGKAMAIIQSAIITDYITFSEATTEDNKEQTLAELKHKVAEASQLIGLQDAKN